MDEDCTDIECDFFERTAKASPESRVDAPARQISPAEDDEDRDEDRDTQTNNQTVNATEANATRRVSAKPNRIGVE